MKNVFKRCLKLIALFDSSNTFNLDSNYIKDNIPEYRNLNDAAYKRSFERDKALLKEVGFNLEYENDKWSVEDGYKLKGTHIILDLQSKSGFDIERFINTYSVIKKYLSPYLQLNKDLKVIPILNTAIKERRRVSFIYNDKLRKVYPLGLRFHAGIWYLGADDGNIVKTFKINTIENLKIGNKENLHTKNISEFNFSWENMSTFITVEIISDNDLHRVHSRIFNFTEVSSKENEENITIKLKTNDHHGLIKYLLLVEPKLLNINKQDKEALKRAINGI